ncbi:MAG: DUF3592 domain-containing protein [Pseudolysinimonas sp.]
MSTSDPGVAAATRRQRLLPFVGVVAAVGVLIGPALSTIKWAIEPGLGVFIAMLLIDLTVSIAAGQFCFYVARPTAWAVAAYTLSYLGGLAFVLSWANPIASPPEIARSWIWLLAVPYLAAAVCVVLGLRRRRAVLSTRAHGVDTAATVTAAGVDGQYNYIPHQRLTLRFVDTNATPRWFTTGITGGYYKIGDTIPIRYDPERPDRVGSILVGGQPYVDSSQQP